jgi:hypothetical protein
MSSIGAVNPLYSQSSNPFAQVRPADSSTPGTSGTSGTSSSSSSSSPSNELTGDSFIQLLTAQLQAQDPLNPVDPTTFVTQLVQFNQLEQLIDINSTLSGAASSASTGGSTPSSDSRAIQNFASSVAAAPVQSNPSATPFQI